jgi:hypothetical protein
MRTFAATVVAVLLVLTFAMPSFAADAVPATASSTSAPVAAAKSNVAIHHHSKMVDKKKKHKKAK